jgi:uncharacterized protein (DUF58 family)
MILPTRRGVFLMASGIPLLLALLALSPDFWNWGLLWILIAGILLLLDFVRMPRGQGLRVTVEGPGLLHIGGSDLLKLHVCAPAFSADWDVDVALALGERLLPMPRAVMALGPRERVYDVPVTPQARGPAVVEGVHLRWQGPWGLMMQQRHWAQTLEIPIVPNTRAVSMAAPNLAMNEMLIGQKKERRRGEGREFEALVEFDTGMDRRRIDWKRSARHGKLLAKEFDSERNHQVLFGFDCGQLMGEPLEARTGGAKLSRLDVSINAALMLAHVCLRGGDRVGLFAFDAMLRQVLDPVSGGSAFPLFAREAGRIVQSPHDSNYTLAITSMGGRLQRRSLIVLFSEFVDTTTAALMLEHLGRLARRHLLLFVTYRDPLLETESARMPHRQQDLASAVIAADLARERQIVLERLRRAGLLVLETTPEHLTAQLVEHYLDIRARELI